MFVMANAYKVAFITPVLPLMRTWTLRLYQNDFTPTGQSRIAEFLEASFPGYSPFPLSEWTPFYLNVLYDAQSDPTGKIWIMSGSSPTNLIYGYYMTDPDGRLVGSDRNANGPILMGGIGAPYAVTASLILGSKTPCPPGLSAAQIESRVIGEY